MGETSVDFYQNKSLTYEHTKVLALISASMAVNSFASDSVYLAHPVI